MGGQVVDRLRELSAENYRIHGVTGQSVPDAFRYLAEGCLGGEIGELQAAIALPLIPGPDALRLDDGT